MAIVLDEPAAEGLADVIKRASALSISPVTVTEARRRGMGDAMQKLIDGLGTEIVPVTRAFAQDVAEAYDILGKSVHVAGLNFGDCIVDALAKSRSIGSCSRSSLSSDGQGSCQNKQPAHDTSKHAYDRCINQ